MSKGNNIKFTIEEVREIIRDLGYILISKEYFKNNKEIIIKDSEGYYYSTTLISIYNNKQKPAKFNKGNKYTIENIKLWLKINESPLSLIGEVYVGIKNRLTFKDKNNYFYYSSFHSLLNGNNPEIFSKFNPYTIQNIRLWCKIKNASFKLISDTYEDSHAKLQWQCLKEECGEIFEASWCMVIISEGKGCCGFCHGLQVGISNCLATKNIELAKEWHPTKNGELTPYDVTENSSQYAWWKCDKGHEWYSSISNRSGKNKSGCPKCKTPKGEKRCKEVFVKNNFIEIIQEEFDKLSDIEKNINIYFIPQKKFKGLFGLKNGSLSYDFYLPKYNLLIEYQGNFHDGTGASDWTKKELKTQQAHDKIKSEYAKNNNIILLEIWYYDFDNIETILNSLIGGE